MATTTSSNTPPLATTTALTPEEADATAMGDYKYGFSNDDSASNYAFKSKKGLDEDTIREISAHKSEPQWMLDYRLKAYKHFLERDMPTWGSDLSTIDFNEIYYYIKPTENQVDNWEDLPADIKDTWDRLGIPEARAQVPRRCRCAVRERSGVPQAA